MRTICEGATILLNNWTIQYEEEYECPEGKFPACYHVSHYVGGEEFEIYNSGWADKAEAEAQRDSLNKKAGSYTHTYEVE